MKLKKPQKWVAAMQLDYLLKFDHYEDAKREIHQHTQGAAEILFEVVQVDGAVEEAAEPVALEDAGTCLGTMILLMRSECKAFEADLIVFIVEIV